MNGDWSTRIFRGKKQRKAQQGKMRFTYREYLEFTSREEFERFKDRQPVTCAEIDAVDVETLTRRLQEDHATG